MERDTHTSVVFVCVCVCVCERARETRRSSVLEKGEKKKTLLYR